LQRCGANAFEVVELVEITRSRVDAWNRTAPTIAILLTGLFVGLGYQPFAGSSDIFVVPLSDHSPYAELHEFVAKIRPKSVVPIVRTNPGFSGDPLAASLLDRANMECFAELLNQRPMQNYHIPTSVLEMMNHTGYMPPRSRARKQSSHRSKSVSSTCMSVSNSGQKLSRNSSLFTSRLSVPATAAITTSESKRNTLWWKCTNTSNTATSGIVAKPRVAVRPVRRRLPPDRHLQSPFVKRRQHRWVDFPAPFELRQKRSSMNQLHQKECRWLAASKSHVPSLSNKTNLHPAAGVLFLKQGNETHERHRDTSDITTFNIAHDPRRKIDHDQPVSGSGDSVSQNHADSLRQSSGNSVPTVFQLAELESNTNGMLMPCSVACHQGFEHIKGCVLPSIMMMNHNVSHSQIPACHLDGAINLTTSNPSTAQPAFVRVPDSCNSLPDVEHFGDSSQRHRNDSSGMLENVSAPTISDPHLCRVSDTIGAVIADGTVVDNVSVPYCEFLPCNQMRHLYVDKATHGTALEICADTPLVVDDWMYLGSAESELLSKVSQHQVKRSHNVVLPVRADNVNRNEEMCTQLESGMMLNNQSVLAGDNNTAAEAAAAAEMELTSLPDVVEFPPSKHTLEFLQGSGAENETVLERNVALKSNRFANKQDEQQYNARVAASAQLTSLPPKKKWRTQFRASEVHYCSHRENMHLNISVPQKLTALQSSRMCRDSI